MASLLTGSALAAPAPLSFRQEGGVTELVIPGGDVRVGGLEAQPCGAVLSVEAPGGLDLGGVATGARRVRGVVEADPGRLVVSTECGAAVRLLRRGTESILRVTAAPVPGRKPAQAAPAGEAPAAPDTNRDADFARDAIAKGLAAVDAEPPTPAAAKAGEARRAKPRPDPSWGTGPALLDLMAWRTAPFAAERNRLRQAGDAAALARFLLAWDLGPEALAVSLSTEQPMQPLAAVAAVLVEPVNPAADWLLAPDTLKAADGPLWAAVLMQRRGKGQQALAYLPAAARALEGQPPEFRRPLGLDLLAVAAEAGLDGFAREFARQVETANPTPVEQAQLLLLVGRLHATAGRAALALAQWDKAAALPGPAAARARLLAAEQRFLNGDLPDAVWRELLDGTMRDWPGTGLEAEVLAHRAALEQREGRLVEALGTLRVLADRFPGAADTARSGVLLAGLLGEPGASLPLARRITLFERGRPLLPPGPEGRTLRQAYADLLAGAGMVVAAGQERAALAASVPEAERPGLLPGIARAQLAQGDAAGAEATLALLPAPSPALQARLLVAQGQPGAALEKAGTTPDPDALSARALAHWQLGEWAEAAGAYRTLAGKAPLSREESVRLALAGILAGEGHPAGLSSLDGTDWPKRLHALAPATDGPVTAESLKALLRQAGELARAP